MSCKPFHFGHRAVTASMHRDMSRYTRVAVRPRGPDAIWTSEEAHELADEMQDSGQWPRIDFISNTERNWAFWTLKEKP